MLATSNDFPFGIMDVAELLHLHIRRPYAKGYYADCPICGDNRGKMSLSTELNTWRCNYCGESGGMLSLYGRINHISNSAAYREISTLLQNSEFESSRQVIFPYKKEPELPKQSGLADVHVIHQTFSALLEMLKLSPNHREHLKNVRGLTDKQIDELGYKSTPSFFLCRKLTERLIEKGCMVQGVPGFYMKDGRWTIKFCTKMSGILIPVRGIDGLIYGMQIRLDVPIKDENDDPEKSGTKYIWLSSSNKPMGVSSGTPIHFIGDPYARNVYITEGFLKADISHCLTNRTFAATAGANNTSNLEQLFKILKQNGTETIIEAEDMDKYRNEQVNKGASKVYMLARKCGLQFRRLTWNPNYKGFDDWQLSLKRSQSCKEHKMNFKRRFIYGLCEFETIHDEIKAWHNAKAQNESPEEYLGFTSEEFESYMKKDEESFIHYLLSFQKQQKFRIYQLDFSDGKTKPFAFEGLQALQKAGFEQPPASEYALICEDTLLCCTDDSEEICLKLIFNRYNDNLPKVYCGRSIAPSDIVELYDEREKKYFYRDENLFYPVKFSPTQIKT